MNYKVHWSDRLKYPLFAVGLVVAGSLACSAAQATPIPLGFISWDVTVPGSFGQFDIGNETGPNSSPPTWPVTTEVQFSSLSLVVHFSDCSTTTFGPSYFTLNPDGESLDGSPIAIGGVSPQPTEAVLTGGLTPTSVIVNGTPMMLDPSFDTATILPSGPPNLSDGDLAIINAEPSSVTPTPEPNMSLSFLMGGLMVLILARRLRRHDRLKTPAAAARFGRTVGALFVTAAILFPAVSFASTLHQNTASTPGSGVAGISFVNITATGFPSGPINPAHVTIRLAPTCTVGATGPVAGEADATATSVRTVLGNTDRVNFEVPSTLLAGGPITTGTYMAQIVDTTDGFAGGNCSIVMVTASTTSLNACVPTSSLGVVTGTTVTAYVPNGWWGGTATGLTAVPIEGALGSSTPISTPNVVNSCAGNPASGQVVCTGNNTDVYLISGTPPTLTNTLTSGLTGFASFSGGSCNNCGVAVNALTNTAVINGGAPTSLGGGDGVQILNLNTTTFQTPFKMTQAVSENISIDPGRNLILSPNENNNYVLLSLNSATGAVTGEFDNAIFTEGGEPDSAAEDCSTGIALSSVEFTNFIYLANLTQATFTPGSPGSWTAPSLLFLPTGAGSNFSAGISGISVAQGSSHLAIYTGEFGSAGFGVLQLPATQSSGSPTVIDYVTGLLPPTPDGFVFETGCDPHTVTAYTSPNTGLPYGVMVSSVPQCFLGGTPTWVAVIDLAKTIDPVATPRQFGTTHTIDPAVDLIANGNVRYVKVQ